MEFPAVTCVRDSKGRLRYYLFTNKSKRPKLPVARVWVDMQLRKKLIIDARPGSERGPVKNG